MNLSIHSATRQFQQAVEGGKWTAANTSMGSKYPGAGSVD